MREGTLLLFALLLGAASLDAQQVRLTGRGDAAVDRRIERLLERRDLLVIAHDTLIVETDTLRRPVLVLDARLILEGRVEADLIGVTADLFLRPRSSVAGDLVNVAGGLYRSALSSTEAAVLDLPLARYRVDRTPDEILIVGETDFVRLRLDGPFGLHAPTYDRASGLRMAWGASYDVGPRGGPGPVVHGQLGYASQRGDLEGGADVRLHVGGAQLEAGLHRTTRTNEEWIRSALINSIHYLWNASDYRDYYDARIAYVEARRQYRGQGMVLAPTFRLELEDARSLPAGNPWSIFRRRRPPRPNPPVDELRLATGSGQLGVSWRGHSAAMDLEARVEVGGTVLGGERAFARGVLTGDWEMESLWDHRLEFGWHLQTPLWGPRLPRQRWSYVGGFGNLQTLPRGLHRGESVVYLETMYWIPFPDRVRLPLVGVPSLVLLHGAGRAWNRGEDADLVQNVGARLQLGFLFLRYLSDPAARVDHLDVGLSWPFARQRF